MMAYREITDAHEIMRGIRDDLGVCARATSS
jgi:hypothetical protein